MAELEEIEDKTKVRTSIFLIYLFDASLGGPSKDHLINQGSKLYQFISIHQEGSKLNKQA